MDPEVKKTRKPAPPVEVSEVYRDDRQAILAELEDPEYVHMFQRGGITPQELSRNRFEIVKDANGVPVQHGSDVVVRISREEYKKKKARESAEAVQMSSKIARNPEDVRQFRDPKKPKIRKEEKSNV